MIFTLFSDKNEILQKFIDTGEEKLKFYGILAAHGRLSVSTGNLA